MVATDLTANASDQGELPVLLDAVKETFAAQPETVLADAGYCNERDLTDLEERGIDGYVALGREGKQTATRDREAHPATARMVEKLATPAGRTAYAERKWLSEAPNGWIKHVLGFRRFSLRGLAKVRCEWDLVCLALNVKRLQPLMAGGADSYFEVAVGFSGLMVFDQPLQRSTEQVLDAPLVVMRGCPNPLVDFGFQMDRDRPFVLAVLRTLVFLGGVRRCWSTSSVGVGSSAGAVPLAARLIRSANVFPASAKSAAPSVMLPLTCFLMFVFLSRLALMGLVTPISGLLLSSSSPGSFADPTSGFTSAVY